MIMNTIYWLTRLAILQKTCTIVFIILGIVLLGALIAYFTWYSNDYNKNWDDDIEQNKTNIKWLRNAFIVLFVCLSGTLFIPDKKDMLLIYGVGPIYDYVQDNDKVKQLPDKCIDYLDALVGMEKEELLEQKNINR